MSEPLGAPVVTESADEPVAVIVACFDSDRWDATCEAIESVLAQTHPAVPIVVVDHNDELYARMRRWCPPEVLVLRNELQRGASGARNTGVRAAHTKLIAFLDDDAAAEPTWLADLVEAARDALVVGVGGAIRPAWQAGAAPPWFPDEFGWVVGATAAPVGGDQQRVRNVWTGNMLVRREIFLQAGGFRDGFGKVAGAREPEDTELCIRMSAASGGGQWRLLRGAGIDHQVPAQRATRAYFLRRCWDEGAGKAALSAVTDTGTAALSSEHDYVTRVVPAALAARARAAARGELAATDQAAMMVAGVAAAGTAFAARRAAASRGLSRRRRLVPASRVDARGAVPVPGDGGTAGASERQEDRTVDDPSVGVPILMYHSLSRDAAPAFRRFALDPALFEDHLSLLADQGYRTLTVSDLVERRMQGEPIPERTVVITFDDGFADFHTHALPALLRHGMTATLYVVTGGVGRTCSWLRDEGEGDRPILSWEQLDEIVAGGVECAAHTHTHPQMDVLHAERVRDELSRPKSILEDRLQVPVHSFAYPYGYHSAQVRAAVSAAGYRSACAVSDQVSTDEDRFAVTRLTVPAGTATDGLADLLVHEPPTAGERRWGQTKQLIWRGLRQHGPRGLVGTSASGVPAWAAGRR
jgi:peptidoglycan/xylan/chitin deacetylase (PgdA/CDA1 family)/GT2 family glycosyltransferase